MNNWDKRYTERVKLLVTILPTLAEEKRFALKCVFRAIVTTDSA
jgi:hypothetical protein